MEQHRHDHDGADSLAELLELDAEVLHSYLSDVTTWVRRLAGGKPRRRIVDLGAGTGVGTIALARAFVEAEVIAVDRSEEMLSRLRAKASGLGLADRIRTVHADVDEAWPIVDPVDVVWASNSLHHLSQPDRVLRDVFATLCPGGLLAVTEMNGLPRFLPDDIGLGRPGLETRCRDALAQEQAESLPHLGSDWGPRLAQAGFAIRRADLRHRPALAAVELRRPLRPGLPASNPACARWSAGRRRPGRAGRAHRQRRRRQRSAPRRPEHPRHQGRMDRPTAGHREAVTSLLRATCAACTGSRPAPHRWRRTRPAMPSRSRRTPVA